MGKARSAALVRPRLVALDCEMVATADGDSNALVKVSLVDEQGTVLYQVKEVVCTAQPLAPALYVEQATVRLQMAYQSVLSAGVPQ